jgi:hypothetical protein
LPVGFLSRNRLYLRADLGRSGLTGCISIGKLFVIDLATSKVAKSFDIPAATGELLLTPDGRFAFVSCPQPGVIEVFDVPSSKLLEPIKLTPGVDGLAWASAIP